MEWIDRMNNAVDYIELNLTDEISYEKLAQIACCSTYHFQECFHSLRAYHYLSISDETFDIGSLRVTDKQY